MVYRKNRQGCSTCLNRKVRCDAALPVCERCKKLGLDCVTSTRQKNSRHDVGKIPFQGSTCLITLSAPAMGSSSTRKQDLDVVGFRLREFLPQTNSWDQRVWSLMLQKVKARPALSSFFGGPLSAVSKVDIEGSRFPPLLLATASMISAFRSRTQRRNYISPESIHMHVKALQMTREALNDTRAIDLQQTLMTILILSSYETIHCPGGLITPWSAHIQGAIALVISHGPKHFANNDLCAQLLSSLQYQLILSVMGNCNTHPCSPSQLEHLSLLPPTMHLQDQTELFKLAIRLVHLNAQIQPIERQPLNHASIDLSLIEKQVREAESQLCRWSEMQPSPTASIREMSLWNTYRTIRIFANQLILRCGKCQRIKSTTAVDESEYKIIRDTLQVLVDETCATAPFFLGPEHVHLAPIPYGAEETPVLGGYLLMWPLYIAGCVEGIESSQRDWISKRLDFIGDDLGMKQASALSNLLKFKERIRNYPI